MPLDPYPDTGLKMAEANGQVHPSGAQLDPRPCRGCGRRLQPWEQCWCPAVRETIDWPVWGRYYDADTGVTRTILVPGSQVDKLPKPPAPRRKVEAAW